MKKLSILLPLAILISFSACKEDISIGSDQDLDNLETTVGTVRNVASSKNLASIYLFGASTGTAQMYYEVPQAVATDTNIEFEVDATLLDAYNTNNGTSYVVYPTDLVSFSNSGTASITSGQRKSTTITMTVNAGGTVGTTYALPVTVKESETGTVGYYIYLVKPQDAIPSSDKGTGIKTIGYMEVNDENILNLGEYTMKSTGKPFFDVVNIFAANINFNTTTNQVYINCNENVSYVLQNADQIIRPLQAKGIKVCLTILGNHDEAGVANLSEDAAKAFALELKNYMDIYGLDGVDFDDEYTNYNYTNPSAGFVTPSGEAFARLVAECRKVMPDKIISFYDFSSLYPTGSVDGTSVGELLDYSYWGAYYGSFWDRSANVEGLGIEKYGPISFNMDFNANGSGYELAPIQAVRDGGYGIQMLYNFKPLTYDYSATLDAMGQILYDDNVVWSGKTYAKTALTSTYYKPSYESYIGTWTLKPSQGIFYDTVNGYFQWTDDVSYTLTIEANVEGESYKVYGWAETGTDVPLIMNYSDQGRIHINMPQSVTATDGTAWTYVARYNFNTSSADFTMDTVTPAFTGYLDESGSFVIQPFRSNYTLIKSFAPIQYSGGETMDALYGGWYQDVAYAPYTLTKQ